jgi:hypothetical protein
VGLKGLTAQVVMAPELAMIPTAGATCSPAGPAGVKAAASDSVVATSVRYDCLAHPRDLAAARIQILPDVLHRYRYGRTSQSLNTWLSWEILDPPSPRRCDLTRHLYSPATGRSVRGQT